MFILHPFAPDIRQDEQQHTFQALDVIRDMIHDDSFIRVVHAATPGKESMYEMTIINHWNMDDMIICEQDIVPRTSDIKSLIECPHPVCVAAHYLYPCSIGGNHPVIAHRKWNGNNIVWLNEGEEWADIVALGLIKISKEIQHHTDILQLHKGIWDSIDIRLSDLISRSNHVSFHVHYPIVEHRHWRND